MFKNVASQKIAFFSFDYTTGAPKTGDAGNMTGYVDKDWGGVNALTDTSASEISSSNAPGWYQFDVSQSETNADALLFTCKSTTGNVSVVGQQIYTTPPNFSTLSITSAGLIAVVGYLRQNVAFAGFMFMMTDSTNHNPVTGKTVTVTRSIDGAAFASGALSAVTEVGSGIYYVDFAAGDLNGRNIVLLATATGCDATYRQIVTFQ